MIVVEIVEAVWQVKFRNLKNFRSLHRKGCNTPLVVCVYMDTIFEVAGTVSIWSFYGIAAIRKGFFELT
jgi:hypothetical protein